METLRNASVPSALMGGPGGGIERLDITIADGKIASLSPHSPGPGRDLDGGLVLPAFVDVHTHLDKGNIWPRKPNPDGTWMGALESVLEDREAKWAREDVARRMDFSLRCAYAHGTAAIRTHLDSAPPQHEITWEVFREARERWAGRIELQAVSIIGADDCLDRASLDSVARVVQRAEGILGGAIAVHPEARKAVFNAIDKAGDLGLAIDLHIDETLDPEASALRHFADAVIETGFKGAAVAGHCCVLSVQDEKTARSTIERVAEAGIAVVSLPMCNLYLQDRDPSGRKTPARRGVTLVRELHAAGVPVAIGSDNTRDPFYAYGDLDGLEVLREGARIIHFDHPQDQAWQWSRMVNAGAAKIAGFSYRGEIVAGAPADLVAFRARNWTELLSRPQSDRAVYRSGVPIDGALPDYRELDDLMEV
ncbi:MAG TPA: cytosine deaminase [Devosia sp.]|nr:cytosine deaminase [Devosia sp.]